jgi:hypothetical protein
MSDIELCQNHNCPSAQSCNRYTAEPNSFRKYCRDGTPSEDGKCESYLFNGIKQVKNPVGMVD